MLRDYRELTEHTNKSVTALCVTTNSGKNVNDMFAMQETHLSQLLPSFSTQHLTQDWDKRDKRSKTEQS